MLQMNQFLGPGRIRLDLGPSGTEAKDYNMDRGLTAVTGIGRNSSLRWDLEAVWLSARRLSSLTCYYHPQYRRLLPVVSISSSFLLDATCNCIHIEHRPRIQACDCTFICKAEQPRNAATQAIHNEGIIRPGRPLSPCLKRPRRLPLCRPLFSQGWPVRSSCGSLHLDRSIQLLIFIVIPFPALSPAIGPIKYSIVVNTR
jgi:hypothetical protein